MIFLSNKHVQKARFFFPSLKELRKEAKRSQQQQEDPKYILYSGLMLLETLRGSSCTRGSLMQTNVMFLAFTTLERDHCTEMAWFQEQKQETLRLTAEACRGLSPDLNGLCICKHPNGTKEELLPAFSCSLKCCGDLLTQQMIQMTVNMW